MKKITSENKTIVIYLALTFGFSWLLWGSKALYVNGVTQHPFVQFISNVSHFGAWGPFVAALLITSNVGGTKGLKFLIKKTFNMGYSKIWIIPTLFLFPLIIGGPLLIMYFFNQTIPELVQFINPAILPIAFFVILFNAGPLQEEYGWRGILQENLQSKSNALVASLMTGFVWGIWHIPLFFIPDQGFYYNKPIWGLVLSTTLMSVLFAWIYNNTNKNLLLMLIFHTMYNFSHYIFPTLESDLGGQLYFLFMIIAVAGVVLKSGFDLRSSLSQNK